MSSEEGFIEFKIIDDRKYSKEDMWFQLLESDEETGDLYKIGVSDFLQAELGDISRVVLSQPANIDELETFSDEDEEQSGTGAKDAGFSGHEAMFGDTLVTLNSASGRYVVESPVACHIVELNGEVEDSPELVNDDPYGDGWLLIIRPHGLDEDELLDPEEYLEHLSEY